MSVADSNLHSLCQQVHWPTLSHHVSPQLGGHSVSDFHNCPGNPRPYHTHHVHQLIRCEHHRPPAVLYLLEVQHRQGIQKGIVLYLISSVCVLLLLFFKVASNLYLPFMRM